MRTGRNELIAGIFSRLASFSTRRPIIVLAIAFALTVASVISLKIFPLSGDASRMIPSGTPALSLISDMMEAFRLGGDADIAVRGKSSSLAAFAKNFKEEIARRKGDYEVATTYAEQYRIGGDTLFIARMLLNLPPDSFDRLLYYTTPSGLRDVVAGWKRDRTRIPQEALASEPVLLRQIVADAVLEKSAPLWLTDRLRTSKDGEWLRITVTGEKPAADVEFSDTAVKEIEAAAEAARERTPGIKEMFIAGGYPAAVANQASVKRDIVQTIAISGALVLIIFLVGFRQAGSILHVGLPLAMAVVCTFGLCAAIFGRMYLGSAVFACILIGLGVDYPIHLYNQMSIELSNRRGWEEALRESARKVGPGAFGAAITTIAAFSLFLFLPFRPLVELGAIASTGLAVCVLATFTVLPALLSLGGGRAARALGSVKMKRILLPRIICFASSHSRTVCIGAAALIAASALVFFLRGNPGIPFTFEMGKFVPTSPADMAKRERMEELFPSASRPSLVVAWRARSRHEAFARGIDVRAILEPLRGSLISDYYSPLRLFQTTEIYRRNLSKAREELLGAPLVARLDDAIRRAGEKPADFESSRTFLASLKEALAKDELRNQIGDLEAPMWSSSIAPLGDGFVGVMPLAISHLKQNPYDLGRIVRELGEKLDSLPGGWAKISGWLILEREIVGLLKKDLAWTMVAGALTVMLISLALFQSFGRAALALTPVAFATATTLGTMKLAGIDFNYLTVAAFPIIVGVSVDSGIHLVHRARGSARVDEALSSTGRAVFLTTLTTVSAFGSFVTSWNAGLREFGWVFNAGLIFSLFASLLLLPAIIFRFRHNS